MTNSGLIRAANKADIPQIDRLMKSEPGFWHGEWRPDVVKRGLDTAEGLAFVWEKGGRIEGFVCAHDVGFLAYLSILVVGEGARGQGAGRDLVARVEEVLAGRGCAVVIADVWKDAVGFYEGLGWRPPDVVLMRKRVLDG